VLSGSTKEWVRVFTGEGSRERLSGAEGRKAAYACNRKVKKEKKAEIATFAG